MPNPDPRATEPAKPGGKGSSDSGNHDLSNHDLTPPFDVGFTAEHKFDNRYHH